MNKFPLQKDKEIDDMRSYQESIQFRMGVSFFAAMITASVGYPIGKSWKIYEHVFYQGAFYVDALFNWWMIFAAMEYIYWVNGLLDRSSPWKEGWEIRLSKQLVVAICGAMFFMECYDAFYTQITGRTLLRIPNSLFQLSLSVIWSVPYSFYCCIRSLHGVYMEEVESNEKVDVIELANTFGELEMESPIVAIKNGKSVHLKDIRIALIVYNDGINRIYPLDPDEEALDDNHSLSYLYSFLDQHQYKKGGRDYIVNREIVKGYTPQADGNILLILKYPYEGRLYVSKGQTEDFIQWLHG